MQDNVDYFVCLLFCSWCWCWHYIHKQRVGCFYRALIHEPPKRVKLFFDFHLHSCFFSRACLQEQSDLSWRVFVCLYTGSYFHFKDTPKLKWCSERHHRKYLMILQKVYFKEFSWDFTWNEMCERFFRCDTMLRGISWFYFSFIITK